MTPHEEETKTIKRLAYLYFLGISIEPAYHDIIKPIADFYDCYEKIEFTDILLRDVLCGLDKEQNILFVLDRTRTGHELIYTETLDMLAKKIGWVFYVANKIVAKHKGIEFEYWNFYGSDEYYITNMQIKIQNIKTQNLETLPLRATV